MNNTKPFWQSVTFWGVMVSAGGKLVAGVFGVDWDEGDVNMWTATLAGAGSLVGDVIAWIGRKRATTKIA